MKKKYIPLGVVAIIYEARPSVIIDSVGICIRTGNSIILAGSRHSLNTDKTIITILRNILRDFGICPDNIQYLLDGSHKNKTTLARQKELVDLMIIRGGVEVVSEMTEQALVPIIIAGEGNCHIYIDESASYNMACDIVINSKVPRPKACNAVETVLIHKNWASKYFNEFINSLFKEKIEIFGCNKSIELHSNIKPANINHFKHEFFLPPLQLL